jgi:hypothetical protein
MQRKTPKEAKAAKATCSEVYIRKRIRILETKAYNALRRRRKEKDEDGFQAQFGPGG